MTVIIYRKSGGKRIQKRLRELEQTETGPVLMMGSAKGSMNQYLWPKVLDALAKRTVTRRGVTSLSGKNWKYGLALYVDSYAVHLKREVANDYAADHGIFIRPLLRNSSHLQQPVDRHIGICFKNTYRDKILRANGMLQHMVSQTATPRVTTPKKYMQMCCGAMHETVNQVESSVIPL